MALASILIVHFNATVTGYFTLPHKLFTSTLVQGIYLGDFGSSLFFIVSGASLALTVPPEQSPWQFYKKRVKAVFPLFLFNQMLAAFLRNDGAPALATLGVLSGGIFNVFGDWFFVFPCDMGVYGAGLATALGSAVSFLVMLTHFASRKNTLRLVKPKRLDAKAA